MLLSLSRVDYVQVGCTSPKSMCLLPVTQNDPINRIVVGDHSGTLSIFTLNDGVPMQVVKNQSETKIIRVELGAPENHVRNRIFYAAGTEVRGLTRSGKEFLCFKTNLCEDIGSMCVTGVDLFVCGDYTLLQYKDLKDERFATISDRIHDVVCLPRSDPTDDVRCVVACEDRSIRLMRDATMVASVEGLGIPRILKAFDGRDQVLYGTADGKLGLVSLDCSGVDSPRHLWTMTNNKREGAFTSLDLFDVTGNGVPQVIVGREDGLVEIHAFLEDGGAPEKQFSCRLEGSVTTVCGGFVARSKVTEVVCCTFAGWVSALTTDQPLWRCVPSLGETAEDRPRIDQSVQRKLESLKVEMRQLRTRVETERRNLKQAAVASVFPFSVNNSFRLDPSDASYVLTIEVRTGIDFVLLQSDVSLELAKDDSSQGTIVSITSNSSKASSPFLATFRCQLDNTTRLYIRLRTTEGLYGILRAYVCPRGVHPKATKLLQFDIKPLSLHQRTTAFDDTIGLPLNCLLVTGNYSLAEIHSWLAFCLPGLPGRTPPEDKVSYSFVSTLLGTVVELTCAKGQGSIRSDNLTTIMILSDVMSSEATKRKISLHIRCTIDETSIVHTLRLIQQMLSDQLDVTRKVQMVETLMDLAACNKDASHLTASNQALLRDADRLTGEHRTKSLNVGRLRDAVVRLFVDCCRFRGWNVKPRINTLNAMLGSGSFSLQDLKDIFTKTRLESASDQISVGQ